MTISMPQHNDNPVEKPINFGRMNNRAPIGDPSFKKSLEVAKSFNELSTNQKYALAREMGKEGVITGEKMTKILKKSGIPEQTVGTISNKLKLPH
jgi:hypothetical protein